MPKKNTENKKLSICNVKADKFNKGDLVKWYTFYEDLIVNYESNSRFQKRIKNKS